MPSPRYPTRRHFPLESTSVTGKDASSVASIWKRDLSTHISSPRSRTELGSLCANDDSFPIVRNPCNMNPAMAFYSSSFIRSLHFLHPLDTGGSAFHIHQSFRSSYVRGISRARRSALATRSAFAIPWRFSLP